jgi:hypothetical protein
MDKAVIIIIGVVILAGIGFWAFQSGVFTPAKASPLPEGIVLFFGADCPHCKIVEDYISQNKIEEKVQFTKLEVPFGTKTSPELLSNAKLAIQMADSCKIDTSNGISIPFLYDGKNCLVGQDDVIKFFKNAANIK